MNFPVLVTFRNMAPSPSVERAVSSNVAKLQRLHPRINSCRVMVELPHRHHQKGALFHVRVDLTVPRGELVCGTTSTGANHAHEDVYVALRDAFRTVRRGLLGYSQRLRGEVKAHPFTAPPR